MASSSNRRLTASEWAEICTFIERGEKNVRELAELYGVTRQAISAGLKERGVERGSRLDEVVNEADQNARSLREARVANANKQVETYAQFNDTLARLAMRRVVEGEKSGNLAAKHADILVLKNAMAVVEKARAENWEILGVADLLGDEAELPDLNIGEYSESELEAIRANNEEQFLEGIADDDGDDDDSGMASPDEMSDFINSVISGNGAA